MRDPILTAGAFTRTWQDIDQVVLAEKYWYKKSLDVRAEIKWFARSET